METLLKAFEYIGMATIGIICLVALVCVISVAMRALLGIKPEPPRPEPTHIDGL
jgi:hypothetical protein